MKAEEDEYIHPIHPPKEKPMSEWQRLCLEAVRETSALQKVLLDYALKDRPDVNSLIRHLASMKVFMGRIEEERAIVWSVKEKEDALRAASGDVNRTYGKH